MTTSVEEIVSKIVELSLNESSDDPVRNIYSVHLKVSNGIGNIMRDTLKQKRENMRPNSYA